MLASIALAVIQLGNSEPHLANVCQVTFGGQNAEAYWDVTGNWLTYQASVDGYPDEQIFLMRADGSDKRLVSTGKGRCTCGYMSPDGKWVYFSSTHKVNEGPQPRIDMSQGYVWMVNPQYALYRAPVDQPNAKPELLIDVPGRYIAEVTIAPNSQFMVWTCDAGGDLEIYRSDLLGRHVMRLTHEVGYDGGPFVSWDSKKVVYRRSTFKSREEIDDYRRLLERHLVRPSKMEIWIMDSDGRNKRQVTRLGSASFAPFLHPDGKRIIFSSNFGDPKGREFDLFLINVDGTGLRRITKSPEFDGFPMFSRDGKRLVFASNRNGKVRGETNIFVADWKE